MLWRSDTMNRPLLTVIVPCYNVEKYVDKCIASIVDQTYSNLEILLIDDGSADNTGTICDTWQERDSRIRVIHKQNEGLPYARKTGMEHTTAEYVTFLDSDDWIDLNMYSDLMAALLSTDSDIAQCGVCEVYEDERIVHRNSEHKTRDFEVVGRVEGVLLISDDKKWRSWMGNKIYRKHLFEGIEFPKARRFAEDFISHDLFHKAKQSVYLHREYYFYLQRSGSITKVRNVPAEMKNQCDYFEAHFERYSFINRHPEYHNALPLLKYRTICVGINLLRSIIGYPQFFADDYFDEKMEQLRSIPVYFTRACFVYIGKRLHLASNNLTGSSFQNIFKQDSASPEQSREQNFSVRITRKDKRNLIMNLYLFVLCPKKCYKYLISFYVRIIRVTNEFKITNRTVSKTLPELFEWLY